MFLDDLLLLTLLMLISRACRFCSTVCVFPGRESHEKGSLMSQTHESCKGSEWVGVTSAKSLKFLFLLLLCKCDHLRVREATPRSKIIPHSLSLFLVSKKKKEDEVRKIFATFLVTTVAKESKGEG